MNASHRKAVIFAVLIPIGMVIAFLLYVGHARAGSSPNKFASHHLVKADSGLEAAGFTWETECVDCRPEVMSGDNDYMNLDAQDNPHLAFGQSELYHAWREAGQWQVEMVEAIKHKISCISLDVGSSGYPSISYVDLTDGVLKYAEKGPSGWQFTQVDNNLGEHCGGTSLEVDAAGYAHISYSSWSQSAVKYAYQDLNGWHVSIVDLAAAGAIPDTSLALDQEGYAHMSYYYQGLKYAYQDSSGWHIVNVNHNDNGYYSQSLALDQQGRAHIAYTNRALYYALIDENYGVITTTLVSTITNGASAPSIVVDSSGFAHISFGLCSPFTCTSNWLGLAEQDSDGWQYSIVVRGENIGRIPSLALDSKENLHIAYVKDEYDDLYIVGSLQYAFRSQSEWHIEPVVTGGRLTEPLLKFDLHGNPHLLYWDEAKYQAVYATKLASDTWNLKSFNEASFHSRDNNLDLTTDDDGIPHIVGATGTEDLIYSVLSTTGWQTQDVFHPISNNIGWVRVTVGKNGIPRIGFSLIGGTSGNGLYTATLDGTYWRINPILPDGGACGLADMGVDSQDHLHVIANCNGSSTRHFFEAASGWQVETIVEVNTSSPAYRGVMAIDRFNRIHFTYSYSTEDPATSTEITHLYYAYRDEDSWNIEQVASIEPPSNDRPKLSIDLDFFGFPHIAYNNDTELVYLYKTQDGWQSMVLDAQAFQGQHSMAVDSSGYPHIAFSDDLSLDLKYLSQIRESSPPANVLILGSTTNAPGIKSVFTASVGPEQTTTPILYTWSIPGLAEITHLSGLTDTAAFTFTQPGLFTLTLTAANASGVVTTTHAINVPDLPLQGLAASNSSPALPGEAVVFTATLDFGTRPVYTWDFGDGKSAAGAVVTHTFDSPGVVTATLTATNSVSSLTADTQVMIGDVPLQGLAAFNSGPVLSGEPVVFTATLQAGTSAVYTWDFGDGQSAAGAVVTHTYPAPGVITATVTAGNSSNELTAATQVSVVDAIKKVYLPLAQK